MQIENLQKYHFLKNKKIKKFELLKIQGYCNNNYLLQTPNQNYLVREFKLSNNRKAEFRVQQLAYKKRIASKPLILDEPNGLMICEFIEGRHQRKLSQQQLKKMAQLLIKLHQIKIRLKRNSFKNNFSFKDTKIKKAFIILEKQPKEYALGHNDLHPKNILFHKKNIKLIDWEYARYSDIYFDLVSIIIEYKLNTKDTKTFLRSYFLEKKINYKKIDAFRLIYKELWELWFNKLAKGEL